jgi:predicted PurR-regulated permease PerM
MRRIIWYILITAATLMVLIMSWQFSLSFILFALSLAISAALKPFINQLAGRFKSRPLALGMVYSVFVGLILIILLFGGQFVLQDFQTAADDFVIAYNHVKMEWPINGSIFQQTLAERLPSSSDLFQAFLSEEGFVIMTADGVPGQNIFTYFGFVAIILVISVYWSTDQLRFEHIGLSLFPAEHRPKALHIWRMIEGGVGAYLRSEIIQSVLAGLILAVGYWMIGLSYPALLALWAAVARLIPWFGALIAVIPLLVLGGILTFSGLLSILFTVAVIFLLKTILEPRILEQKTYNSLLIILFVIILAEAFGVIGVLLALPLATAVQILLQELYPLFARRYTQELMKVFNLKRRLSIVRSGMKDSSSSEITQYVNQLHELVNQTITYMQKY